MPARRAHAVHRRSRTSPRSPLDCPPALSQACRPVGLRRVPAQLPPPRQAVRQGPPGHDPLARPRWAYTVALRDSHLLRTPARTQRVASVQERVAATPLVPWTRTGQSIRRAECRFARVALAPPDPASLELFVRRDPPASPLAALSLALTQPTAPDLWFSPGPQDSGKELLI